MKDLHIKLDHSVVVEDDVILEIGPAQEIRSRYKEDIESNMIRFIDMTNSVVLPGFVDPHTHALFTGTREDEFQMRIEGRSYVDILIGGGGILNTVNKVRKASIETLVRDSLPRMTRMLEYGTTTCEIKKRIRTQC